MKPTCTTTEVYTSQLVLLMYSELQCGKCNCLGKNKHIVVRLKPESQGWIKLYVNRYRTGQINTQKCTNMSKCRHIKRMYTCIKIDLYWCFQKGIPMQYPQKSPVLIMHFPDKGERKVQVTLVEGEIPDSAAVQEDRAANCERYYLGEHLFFLLELLLQICGDHPRKKDKPTNQQTSVCTYKCLDALLRLVAKNQLERL